MAEVIRYIDPDAAGAATGLDWTNAYTSGAQWEAASQTDLDAAGNWHHAYVRSSAGTADATFTINAWTTSTNCYILIEAASTDRAISSGWRADKYRIINAGGDGIFCLEDFVRIDGIQFQCSDQCLVYTVADGADLRVSNCRAQDSNYFFYLSQSGNTPTAKIWNCISDTMATTGIYWRTNGSALNVYNSIFYGSVSRGLQLVSGVLNVYNSAVFNNADDFLGGTVIDHCASDDGDGTNAVAPSGGNWANEFVDAANGDFTLVTGGNCEGGGTDNPGAGLYSDDMNGDAYSSPWSIGVDAKTAGVTGNPYYYYMQQ